VGGGELRGPPGCSNIAYRASKGDHRVELLGNMAERTVNWLIYTCLLGLVPVIARLLVWTMSNEGVDPFAVSDLVAFGLVLHSANINEVNRVSGADTNWKTVHNGMSILFIFLYGLLLFTTIASTANLNGTSILYTTLLLGVTSFILSWSVFRRAQVFEGTRP
jgi:hypothetical protein